MILNKITGLINVYLRRNVVINFSVIETCNARCTMCDVWKSNEGYSFNPHDVKYFDDAVKHHTKHIGISGGEPFLRKDLEELVSSILSCFTNLKSLSITSHGFQEERIKIQLPAIAKICAANGVVFSMNFSIDGDEKTHELQRGVPGGYSKTLRSAEFAKSLKIPVQLQFTATSENVYHAPHVLYLSEKIKASAVFRVATNITRLGQEKREIIALSENERSYFSDFILSDKVMNGSSLSRRIYYRGLSKYLLNNDKFERLCLFKQNGLYIDGKSNAYPCSLATHSVGKIADLPIHKNAAAKARNKLKKIKCPSCIHDQSFIPSLKEYVKELFIKYTPTYGIRRFSFITKAIVNAFLSSLQRSGIKKGTVLVLGQYGGEHVGDSAILGGVLQSLETVDKVDVVSLRPDRTKFWLTGLVNIRQSVEVIPVVSAFQKIKSYEKIVFGGGPIMWLPTILFYHFMLVLLSNTSSIVEIKGCGIIESRSRLFKMMVKKILMRANKREFRSKYSLEFCEEQDISGATLIVDPAITYLLQNYEKN